MAANGDKITKILTGVAYAIILVLQGVNITETGGQTELIKRVDAAIEQQTKLIQQVNQEGVRVDSALKNQVDMLGRMDGLLKNQSDLLHNQEQMIGVLEKEAEK